jgi:hypothetical protein
MFRRFRSHLTYANVMATIAAFLAIGGGAYAVVGSPLAADGTIEGCYRKKGGALRLVKQGQRCRRGERRIAWNRQGPSGARGEAGARGETGARGLAGPTGPPGAPNPDAETLDGHDSSEFVTGGGGAVIKSFRNDVGYANQTEDLVTFPGVGVLRGFCDSTGEKPSLRFLNTSGTALESYFDNGSTGNPVLSSIANGALETHDALNEPDHVQWQLSFPAESDRRVITINANVQDPPSEALCEFGGLSVFQTG